MVLVKEYGLDKEKLIENNKVFYLDSNFLDNLNSENQEEIANNIINFIKEKFFLDDNKKLLFRGFNKENIDSILESGKDKGNNFFDGLPTLDEIDKILENDGLIPKQNNYKNIKQEDSIYASTQEEFIKNNNPGESAIYFFRDGGALAIYNKDKLEKQDNDKFAYSGDFNEALIGVIVFDNI